MQASAAHRRVLRGIEKWVSRRETTRQSTVDLNRRRIFILPTRAGLIFALVLLAMFVGATNYANSLAFLLTFLLAPMGALGMWHTQRNLLNLRVAAAGVEPVFAGQEAQFRIRLENPTGTTKIAIGVGTPTDSRVVTTLGPGGSRLVEIPMGAASRGILRPGRLTISTEYPLGLFQAWSWVDLDMEALVYPRPAGTAALPAGVGGSDSHSGSRPAGHDDFGHLRAYSPGDSPKHVAWKASARGEGLLTKRFLGSPGRFHILDWLHTPGTESESKLSQLTLWLLEADASGVRYAVSLPGTFVSANLGPSHRRHCLRSLALWQFSEHS